MFATPMLLQCGVPLLATLASNQFSAALWTPIATRNYSKNSHLDRVLLFGVASTGILGVFAGYHVIHLFSVADFKRLFGILILCIVILAYRKKDLLSKDNSSHQTDRILPIFFGLPLGAYQGIFGSGNTLFSCIMFSRYSGFGIKRSLAHAYSLAFVWCSLTALLFFLDGLMDWSVALPCALGSFIGAYLGSKVGASLRSETLSRICLLFGAAMGLKIIFFS